MTIKLTREQMKKEIGDFFDTLDADDQQFFLSMLKTLRYIASDDKTRYMEMAMHGYAVKLRTKAEIWDKITLAEAVADE